MGRIEALAKRLAKLAAIKEAEEQPFVTAVHSGSMTLTGAELDRLLKQIDAKTRGLPPWALEIHFGHCEGDQANNEH